MEYWGREGLELWNSKYAPLGAFNYGIGGDQTQNLLWRVSNGELDGISPKVIVVYIGSNNIPTGNTAAEIEQGVSAVIAKIREKLPNTYILHMNIFPRQDQADNGAAWNKIASVNDAIEGIADDDKINVLTIFNDFVASWGVVKEELYLGDKLHFTKAGYNQWDVSMDETFFRLLNA
jgi:lysophospholipase L1-like esterase